MSLAWIAAALIAGTILLEAWLANQRLNEQIASFHLFIDDEEGDDDTYILDDDQS